MTPPLLESFAQSQEMVKGRDSRPAFSGDAAHDLVLSPLTMVEEKVILRGQGGLGKAQVLPTGSAGGF